MDTLSAPREPLITLAAGRLLKASDEREPCPPVRDLIGSTDVAAAYAVQQGVTAARIARGARVVGRKIGLTSAVVQTQLGVNEPDFGVLFDDMQFASGQTMPADAVLQPRAEAEIAFVLGADLTDGDLDTTQVRAAIGDVVAAIEVCGSRVAEWDISLGDTVADNASSGAFVLGSERRQLTDVEPREVTMSMSRNGEVVATGTGAACMGDPINAVAWLARQARHLGDPLRRGQIILSGALGPMVPITAGTTVEATFSGLGQVALRYGDRPQ